MKSKYITLQTRLAYLNQPAKVETKSIYQQIEETLEERRMIMDILDKTARNGRAVEMYISRSVAA